VSYGWQCLVIRDTNDYDNETDSGKKGVRSVSARVLLLVRPFARHQVLGTSLIRSIEYYSWKSIMLTFPKIITRSMLIVLVVISADSLVASEMIPFGFSFVEIIGDVMLVEVAILFIVAGLIDFSSSIGAAQFRKSVLGSKQDYSQSVHKEAERKAVVLVLAGIFIFMVLLGIAVIIHN